MRPWPRAARGFFYDQKEAAWAGAGASRALQRGGSRRGADIAAFMAVKKLFRASARGRTDGAAGRVSALKRP